MDQALERKALIESYRSYVSILHQHGLSFELVKDEELDKLSTLDLNDLVKRVRDLARTPTS